ncbi:MAG TPA: methyltransferase domain-containing protein [Candidatus Saccharimonadales bacterium]|nr:methyltransferase domain-containing protein [Candidatus Saccharimonadales bacterium]
MTSNPANIYESGDSRFSQETQRLASFDWPTQISIEAIGELRASAHILDIGAGPNVQLANYVKSHGGGYTALDKNASFLEKQKAAGAETVLGDIRSLPFHDASFDISHIRFVVSHLGNDKQTSIQEALRVIKPTGKAIFIEYDWTTAHGSPVFEKVKNFMIHGGFLFDADYGHELLDAVQLAAPSHIALSVKHYDPPQMMDYSQVLKLREAGSTDLKLQGKESDTTEWNKLLDALQAEAESVNPPGYFFPGVTVVTATK